MIFAAVTGWLRVIRQSEAREPRAPQTMEAIAACDYQPGELEAVLEFLKQTRDKLRELRKVHVWTDRVQVFDVNGDFFDVRGIGYPDEDITPLLRAIGTNFKPESIHTPIRRPYKEFKTGRRHPWAEDRIL